MQILLVDDDINSRRAVAKFLRQIGHETTECDNAHDAIAEYSMRQYPMVLSDIRMPGMSGIELLKTISTFPCEYPSDIVLFTGYADADSAVEALRAGVYDYLLKPINAEELAKIVQRIEERQNKLREPGILDRNELLKPEANIFKPPEDNINQYSCAGIKVGVFSSSLRDNIKTALKLHTDPSIPVLIEGPTGTGKEIIAKFIHFGNDNDNDNRIKKPFIDINCATLSATLFESELFGYEPNSFTGSSKTGQRGKLDAANGGTLFLDELEALPLDLQGKLLRVIQEKEFYRVGGLQKIEIDVRIICATNVNLINKVQEGSFRSDLYYRLKVGHIELKPLAERPQEIIPLASLFLREFSLKKKKHFKYIAEEAADILIHHAWPGNVRELRNVIEWVVFMYDDIEVKAEHLSDMIQVRQILSTNENAVNKFCIELRQEGTTMEQVKKELILKVLDMHGGNRSAAARYLGISRRTIIEQLKN